MNRFSIYFRPNGPVNSIRMTSRFLGIPIFKVYAFFVDGLLIDTGFSYCRKEFLKLCDKIHNLQTVVNTHHHEDHTGNNFWITKKYGILPLAHPKTSLYMRNPSQWIRFYRHVVWGTPPPSETAKVDTEICTRRFRFLVIPTPGHAEDHICLYEPNEEWLFSGDLFITEEQRNLRDDEDIYFTLDSLKKILGFRVKKMFCAFSGPIDNPEEALRHKIEYLENLQHEVEEKTKQGLSPQEIQKKLLGKGDRYRLITAGQISKQNLIRAFLKQKGEER